jgi:hypothetical protein
MVVVDKRPPSIVNFNTYIYIHMVIEIRTRTYTEFPNGYEFAAVRAATERSIDINPSTTWVAKKKEEFITSIFFYYGVNNKYMYKK